MGIRYDSEMDIDGEMTDMTLVNSFLNIGSNTNGVFQSQKKEKENVNLNANCFNGFTDNMGEKMGTPFKTKTSEMEQNYSVKKLSAVISPPKNQFQIERKSLLRNEYIGLKLLYIKINNFIMIKFKMNKNYVKFIKFKFIIIYINSY